MVEFRVMTFLCIITPVFDGCLDSFRLLVEAAKQQTFSDFIHIAISDGESPLIKKLVSSLDDDRFTYTEVPFTNPKSQMELFFSITSRRDFGLKNFKATRFLFLDADLKVISSDYFQTLYDGHQKHPSKIIMTKIKRAPGLYYPRIPLQCGNINISNYCVTQEMAKIGYPSDFDKFYPFANDYRFLRQVMVRHDFQLLNFVSAEKDGNKTYKNLCDYYK
jgi:hypothetical protein